MTDEIDALERGRLEPAAEPACQLGGRELPSEPWQVEQVDAATLGQRLEYRRPPAPRAGEPVDKDERFALAVDSIVARRSVDNEFPYLHYDQFGSAAPGPRAGFRPTRYRLTVARTTTTTTKDADAISKLADAGEDALRRLVDLPRRAVVGVMDRIGDGLHNAAAKLRAVDPLAGRVAALEERFDSLEKSEETRARAASPPAKRPTGGRPGTAVPAATEQAGHDRVGRDDAGAEPEHQQGRARAADEDKPAR